MSSSMQNMRKYVNLPEAEGGKDTFSAALLIYVELGRTEVLGSCWMSR